MPTHISQLSQRYLKAICYTARHHSTNQAAKALFRSQPSVSRAIQKTEQLLGIVLFHRESRTITPTPCGEILIQGVSQALRELKEAQHACQSISPSFEYRDNHPAFNMDIGYKRWATLFSLHKTLSVQSTSEELGITPKSIVSSVNYFEHLMGAKLFYRSANRVTSTQLCDHLVASADKAYLHIQHAVGEIELLTQNPGPKDVKENLLDSALPVRPTPSKTARPQECLNKLQSSAAR